MKYIISLIANPNRANLELSQVRELVSKWAGQGIRYLSEGIAAEFLVDSFPSDFDITWSTLNDLGIDLVIQPNGIRKKKLLVADMDSTIIEQECLDELADISGNGNRVKEITKRAMNGELPFEDALRERVALLRNESADLLDQTWHTRITFTPGARELVGTMRTNGAYCAMVSGGFTHFTERVSAALGFHETHANSLIIQNNVLTGDVGLPILGKSTKLNVLTRLVNRLGLQFADALAVGDGANDLDMLLASGMGVAFRSYPIVARQSKIRINHGDLTSLLFMQGFSQKDLVSYSENS